MQTELGKIKEIALCFLYLEPEINEDFSYCVQHPFINSNPMIFSLKSGIKSYNIMNREELDEVIDILEGYINKAQDVYEIFEMLRKADKRTFFYYIKDYLSEEDYGELLNNYIL